MSYFDMLNLNDLNRSRVAVSFYLLVLVYIGIVAFKKISLVNI